MAIEELTTLYRRLLQDQEPENPTPFIFTSVDPKNKEDDKGKKNGKGKNKEVAVDTPISPPLPNVEGKDGKGKQKEAVGTPMSPSSPTPSMISLLSGENGGEAIFGDEYDADDGAGGEGSGDGERKEGNSGGERTGNSGVNDKPKNGDVALAPPPARPSPSGDDGPAGRGGKRGAAAGVKDARAATGADSAPPPPAPAPAARKRKTPDISSSKPPVAKKAKKTQNDASEKKRKTPDTDSAKPPVAKKPKKTQDAAPNTRASRSKAIRSPSPPLLQGRMVGTYFYELVRSVDLLDDAG
jgi:hypothetical protein